LSSSCTAAATDSCVPKSQVEQVVDTIATMPKGSKKSVRVEFEACDVYVVRRKKKKKRGLFYFSSRRRHTRLQGDWSSDVCSSDLSEDIPAAGPTARPRPRAFCHRGDRMTVTMAAALNSALRDAMRDDDTVVVYGEDVGRLGGVFRVTDGLQEEWGTDRCFDTPVAESGIVGSAIGMALYGLRPVVEMQFDGFSYPALDQVISHVAKYRNRTRGAVGLPIVIRIPYGGGIGAVEHHSESPETYYAHTAGLTVVSPGTPGDAYVLLRAAIAHPDPVI